MTTDTPPPNSSASPFTPPRLDLRFLFSHPAHLIALGFGSGLSRFAPGTAGTLWAWVVFVILDRWLNAGQWALVLVLSFFIGWWACRRTATDMHVMDPGPVVWDEVLAFWLILWLAMPMGFLGQLVAFALFRFFDAVKPGPIGWADQALKGWGWRGSFGIIFDDLVAAFASLLVIAVWRFVFGA